MKKDLVIIGGGPAGLAAAIAAKEAGIDDLLILERDGRLGGILNQCIHNGFGLHTFKEELTGPEYAGRYIKKVEELKIPYDLNTIVVDLAEAYGSDAEGNVNQPETGKESECCPEEENDRNRLETGKEGGCCPEEENGKNRLETGKEGGCCPKEENDRNRLQTEKERTDSFRKLVTAMSREKGLYIIEAKAVILAMGCRERPRGALNIPGYRPAGIYSAGTAQRYVNMEGRMPGREVVILGSGDIGLIMARRMTLEGAKVKLVAELMPYSGGLKRNIVQCLDDYGIPLKLRTTVVDIKGKERLEAVVIAKVDENSKPIPGTEEEIPCDTLLLSCGLIPENELSGKLGVGMNPVTNGPLVNESLETDREGVFACGNVLHVHDLVDYVSEEAAQAGKRAAAYIQGKLGKTGRKIPVRAAKGVRYTVPAVLDVQRMEDVQVIRFRVDNVYRDGTVEIALDGRVISRRKKKILAPGEMEQVVLKKVDLEQTENLQEIQLRVVTET